MKTAVIYEIIEALSVHRGLSKNDLSKITGNSLQTISKYTEYLLDQNIITASYSNAKKDDFKCIRFNLNHNRYFVIYNFTISNFSMYICNMTGKIRKSFVYNVSDDLSFEENKFYFLKNVNLQLSKVGKNKISGTTVIFSDTYDNNLILKSRLNSLKDAVVNCDNNFWGKSREFISEHIKELITADDLALCLYLNNDSFCSCYITSTTDISNLRYIEVGECFKVKGIPLKDYIDYTEDITDIIDKLSSLIKNISETVPITQVYITGNLFYNMSSLKTLISENLSNIKVTFNEIDHTDFMNFLVKKLRNTMSNALISNYLNKLS